MQNKLSVLPKTSREFKATGYLLMVLIFGCNQQTNTSTKSTIGSSYQINIDPPKGGKKQSSSANNKSLSDKKNNDHSLRKYKHVTELCKDLSNPLIKLCVEKQVPPAAILAIIALESGWGSGYVSQITGNILSLNATKSSIELPALYLPIVKETGRVLFDPNEIDKYSSEQLEYQNRPKSLKKDYRPASIAGTTNDLAYFKYHHDEKVKAEIKCVTDFISRFVSHNSSIAAYREARGHMDKHVTEGGIRMLFEEQVTIDFINTIGGRPNSFNFRETWPKKVESVMHKAGLVSLMKEMYINKKTFEEVW